MLKNYLKIAFRNLLRNKSFSAINISGLAIGMAGAIIIFLWIFNEVSYDNFHANRDNLYAAWNRGTFDGKIQCWDNTPKILGPTIKQEYPEVANISRHYSRWYVTRVGETKVSTPAMVTDPAFLNMFDFPLLQGDKKTALNNVYSIVVTEKMAIKMFGTTDALNKVIIIDKDNFTVTGVLKDLPANTSFQFDYILPWSYLKKTNDDDDSWGNNSVRTYVQLRAGTDPVAFDLKIKNIKKKHSAGREEEEIFLHPMSKWHLYSAFENGKIAGGRIDIIRLFGIIGAFILFIACINFMNLSTARSEKRAREVGIRKTAGASKGTLIGQFIGESILIALFAGIIAMVLALLCLPSFNLLIGKQLEVPYTHVGFWMVMLLFIVFTGTVAGSYPAFFLSSLHPISVLKGTFKKVNRVVNPRKILVVIQFSFAIVLIISTLIVGQQIRHAQNRDAGYDRNQVVYHWLSGDLQKNYQLIKSELLNSGIASSLTLTASPLSFGLSDTWGIGWRGKPEGSKIDFDRFTEDEGLVATAGLTLLQGRDMDLTRFPSDSSAVLLNESAIKAMGFREPIGEKITDMGDEYHVVGVIKDFVLGSPYTNTRPMIILGAKSYFNVMHIRLSPDNDTEASLKKIGQLFAKFNPNYPFEYHFVDQDYALKFEDTRRVGLLTGLFAGLTISISCLGLFGLAAYMAENRVKEIGVRKVLGASVASITALLSREFLILVIISILIATPIAWYAMDIWLKNYVYRIAMQWWVFGLAGLMAIVLSLATVSYQAIKAALLDPVRSLRSE